MELHTKLTILGTGNAMVTKCYNTCFTIENEMGIFLVDAGGGNGILSQTEKAGVDWTQIHHIFITHAHTDHLLGAVWAVRQVATLMKKGKYEGECTIYCHDLVLKLLTLMCNEMLPGKFTAFFGDRIHFQEVYDGDSVTINHMKVTFFDIGSTKAKQFGFQAILPDDQSFVCLGDEPFAEITRPYVVDCDWLMSEAFCLYADREQFKPYEKHHSTALDAGRMAEELGAKHLILYHTEDTDLTHRKENYSKEAAEGFHGTIYVPDDLDVIECTIEETTEDATEDTIEETHKRRVRYKGTHPRTYQEKYKELQPEKYADTVAKVISKGSTPAGMHISICVQEILDFLQIKPGQKGLDATLGFGGHTSHMLKCLQGQGHLYALDVDPIEIVKTKKRLEDMGYGEEILSIRQINFANIDEVCAEAGKFDFVLADLGVSSMQIDNPDRGFSYKTEGPLDLRLNPEKGISAAQRLKEVTQEELQGMLQENSDEPYALELSRAITSYLRKGNKIETTTHLRELIERTMSFVPEKERKEVVKKTCQRTFQALRIDVNSEFEVLEQFMNKLPYILNEGGRVAILTFHSGEDRLVKKSFKYYLGEGEYSEVATEVIRPSAEECALNPRARSTKMRWAIKK